MHRVHPTAPLYDSEDVEDVEDAEEKNNDTKASNSQSKTNRVKKKAAKTLGRPVHISSNNGEPSAPSEYKFESDRDPLMCPITHTRMNDPEWRMII